MKIIPANTLKTAMWQGGTTTELYIFPHDSSYRERNFQFRVSTATIEAPESTFTSLPGISRKIMILDGKITLTHAGRYSKTLTKFGTDSFMGDWDSHSVGLATDFNVMTCGNVHGEMYGFSFKKGETKKLTPDEKTTMLLLYAYKGSFEITGKTIGEKDVVVLNEKTEVQSATLVSLGNGEIGVVELWGI
jgi:environmental stress-induced protein Ves